MSAQRFPCRRPPACRGLLRPAAGRAGPAGVPALARALALAAAAAAGGPVRTLARALAPAAATAAGGPVRTLARALAPAAAAAAGGPVRTLARALALAVAAAAGGPAPALADPPLPADLVQVEMLPGWRLASGRHMAALRVRLAPQWKTYWRSPGEAGVPPEFDWSGSGNLASASLHWPRPEVFHLNGLRTIGYAGDLILPVEVTPGDPGRPVYLHARLGLGICRDICMPVQVTVAARLPAGGGAPDPRIAAALAAAPTPAAVAGLSALRCRVEPLADGLRLTAEMLVPDQGGPETAVVESADPTLWIGEALVRRDGPRLTAAADLAGPAGAPFALDRSSLRITLLGRSGAVDIGGCPGG